MSIDSILSPYPVLNFVCFLQINISVQWFSVQPFLIFCLIHLLNLHFLISKISFLQVKITFLEILFDSFPIFLFFLGNLIAASYATLGLPGGSDGKESACNVGDWVRSLVWEDPLEEGMATHSSILAWRIPWTEEPGRLQSTGLQRVGHHWVTKHMLPYISLVILYLVILLGNCVFSDAFVLKIPLWAWPVYCLCWWSLLVPCPLCSWWYSCVKSDLLILHLHD